MPWGVVIGAPILAVATARLPRKMALLGLIGTYAVGNLLCAISPSYGLLMAARVLTALCHGAFFGVGSVVAGELVLPGKRGQAIALMFSGLTLANVLGVPAGTALRPGGGMACHVLGGGCDRGGGDRGDCLGVAAPRAAGHDEFAGRIQRARKTAGGARHADQRALFRPACSSVFTYIAPMLENVTHLSPRAVSWLLLLFGVGITGGNFLGGRLADWRLMPTIAGTLVALIATFSVLTLTVHGALPVAVTLVIWGALTFTVTTPLQMRVVDAAPEAPNLVATLNQGAFNLGNASGAWLGGLAIGAGVTYPALPWLGAALSASALGLTALSMSLARQPAMG